MEKFEENLDYDEEMLAEDEDAQKDKYITFRLGSEEYAIEIQYVNEIIGMQTITVLPAMPNYLKGVINLRGLVYPIIDVRVRFLMEAIEYNDRTCIIIVSLQNSKVGLIVDEVSEVMNIPEDKIDPPPLTGNKSSRFIKGTGKIADKVIILLDVDNFMTSEEALSVNI